MKVAGKLMKKNINMKDFRLYVINLFPPGDIITGAVNVLDVFAIISRHQLWDSFHYLPLEEIANEFGQHDQELSAIIDKYKAEVAGFKATTKIVDFIKACSSEEDIADPEESIQKDIARYDKRYCHRLTFKLKTRVTEKCLNFIDQFWMFIADHFIIPSLSVLLDSIKDGCVEVTWCVPTKFAVKIQTGIAYSSEFLRKLKITRVMMDGVIIYEAKPNKVAIHVV